MYRSVESYSETGSTKISSPFSTFRYFFMDIIKRTFDILASLAGLLLLFPLFLIIAFIIKRESPGPVFYRGPRAGKSGKIFGILKFRTMREDAESYQGPRITAQDDPRVNSIGRWLRDTKLNELPQLWNVLKGDMSLVGPRPEDPEIAAGWEPEVRTEVLSVRPGITSPASVLYRDEESLLKTDQLMNTYLNSILPSKLRLDQLYVRHRSFWLDLDVLFWTFLVLLPKIGENSPPEEHLFLGPVSRFIRRHLSWFSIDTLVTFIAIGITGLFWRSFGPLDIGLPKAIAVGIGFAFIFSIVGAVFGVNKISWSNTGAMDVLDLIPAFVIATVVAFVIDLFWQPEPLLPPPMILMASGLAFIGFVLVRYRSRFVRGLVYRWLALRGQAIGAKERVMIIGGGEAGQFMSWLLHSARGSEAFRAVGIVDDDLYKQGTRIQGLPVIGRREDIPSLVEKYDIGLIVLAIHNIPKEERDELLNICNSTPARSVVMPDILGLLNSEIQKTPKNESPADLTDSFEYIPSDKTDFLDPSSQEFGSWLSELEASAETGDTQAVLSKITLFKEKLQESHRGTKNQDDPSTIEIEA